LVLEDVDEAQTVLRQHDKVVVVNEETSDHGFPKLKLFIIINKVLRGQLYHHNAVSVGLHGFLTYNHIIH